MPVARPIILNTTTFTPSDIKESETKVGTVFRAANGRLRFAQVTVGGQPVTKKIWTIEWKLIPIATLDLLRQIYRLPSSFPYVGEAGETHTVLCDADALQSTRAFIAGDGTVYYRVSLTIKEV